jgi:hypothetical protein
MNGKAYLSFLLRLWRVRQNGPDVWRASLEDPRTGKRRGFADLELLITFLRDQITGEEQGGDANLRSEEPGKR